MRHHLFETNPINDYKIALLMKPAAFSRDELIRHYVDPLTQLGVPKQDVIAFTLSYNESGKAPAKHIKEYLEVLLAELQDLNTEYLYVTDGDYFKVLTKSSKAEPHQGYVLPCAIKGYEGMKVVLGTNYQALIYNPDLKQKLDRSLNAVASHISGTYKIPGADIINSAVYPETLSQIDQFLAKLHGFPELSADIEAFSLSFNEAGIGTIAFAWDEHNGGAFTCDYSYVLDPQLGMYGEFIINRAVRDKLRNFFETYKGKLTWHNAGYDLKVLIYTLWMKSLDDTAGLLKGLEIMTRLFDDTKIIAYLATNTTAGNVLGLKPLAHDFAGNWAKDDIKDIRKIPLNELLQYNLIDALSTNYVLKKYYPIMVQDNQEDLYKSLMLPTVKLLLQTELTGMPMNKARIQEIKAELEAMQKVHLDVIENSSYIKMMNLLVQTAKMEATNAKLKVKQHPLEKFADEKFNPNSGPQLQKLLYELLGLPIIDTTDTGQPATGAETLEKLINHTLIPEQKDIIQALIGNGQISKILNTFIPAFEEAIEKSDTGIVWLHGSFNLGGTVSGRLSSSDPNLQNIPSNSIFGKLIKSAFMAPEGWIFAGADFNSLEDMISALTTKDTNKLKVYLDGFDGHSLRAAYYFKAELEAEGIFINLEDPKSVNQLKKMAHYLRQESKPPTFLLTYGGTFHGLMNNLGWGKDKAIAIETNYHVLYVESDEYIQRRIKQACKDGYTEVAFGLRVRTPLLGQVIYGSDSMPYAARAEGRTAGNAMGQSYGLLNNRAAVEFMEKVWASEFKYDIKPVALIHDAIYVVIRDDPAVVEFVNRELIKSMQWQELPEIQHDTVKLGANLDLFWPSWANPITLPNDADQDTIMKMCKEAKDEYENKKN